MTTVTRVDNCEWRGLWIEQHPRCRYAAGRRGL